MKIFKNCYVMVKCLVSLTHTVFMSKLLVPMSRFIHLLYLLKTSVLHTGLTQKNYSDYCNSSNKLVERKKIVPINMNHLNITIHSRVRKNMRKKNKSNARVIEVSSPIVYDVYRFGSFPTTRQCIFLHSKEKKPF